VPRYNAVMTRLVPLLPRSWREAIARFMKADKLMVEFDQRARHAYEERAAASGTGEGTSGETAEAAAEREAA
jgi:hypothetical protein